MNDVPTFASGDLVKPLYSKIAGWRSVSSAETAAWYKSPECHDPSGLGHDGESNFPPQNAYYIIKEGEMMTVIKGRVFAPRGYYKTSHCCQVLLLTNGQLLFIKRKDLIRV